MKEEGKHEDAQIIFDLAHENAQTKDDYFILSKYGGQIDYSHRIKHKGNKMWNFPFLFNNAKILSFDFPTPHTFENNIKSQYKKYHKNLDILLNNLNFKEHSKFYNMYVQETVLTKEQWKKLKTNQYFLPIFIKIQFSTPQNFVKLIENDKNTWIFNTDTFENFQKSQIKLFDSPELELVHFNNYRCAVNEIFSTYSQ